MTAVFVKNLGDLGQARLSYAQFLFKGFSSTLAKNLPNPYYFRLHEEASRRKQAPIFMLPTTENESDFEPASAHFFFNDLKFGLPANAPYVYAQHARTYSVKLFLPYEYSYPARYFLPPTTKSWLDSTKLSPYAERMKKSIRAKYKLLRKKYTETEARAQLDTLYLFEKDILYVGELPLMTAEGSFVINGVERVIVSQLLRCSGVYFKRRPGKGRDKQKYYGATILSSKGRWTEVLLKVHEKPHFGPYLDIPRFEPESIEGMEPELHISPNLEERALMPMAEEVGLFDQEDHVATDGGEKFLEFLASESGTNDINGFSYIKTEEEERLEEEEALLLREKQLPEELELAEAIKKEEKPKKTKKLKKAKKTREEIYNAKYKKALSKENEKEEKKKREEEEEEQSRLYLYQMLELFHVDRAYIRRKLRYPENYDAYCLKNPLSIHEVEEDITDLLEEKEEDEDFIYQTAKALSTAQTEELKKADTLRKAEVRAKALVFEEEMEMLYKGGRFEVGRLGRVRLNQKFHLALSENQTVLVFEDLCGIINGLLDLEHGVGTIDDLDHLKYKRVRCIGDIFQERISSILSVQIASAIKTLEPKDDEESFAEEETEKEEEEDAMIDAIRAVAEKRYPKEKEKISEDLLEWANFRPRLTGQHVKSEDTKTTKKQVAKEKALAFVKEKSRKIEEKTFEKQRKKEGKSTWKSGLIWKGLQVKIPEAQGYIKPDFSFLTKSNRTYPTVSRIFGKLFARPLVTLELKLFFTTSEISQYFDQTNPLASLTHKRRVTVLGPQGLQRDRIANAIRDIQPSQYGRICPVETAEGKNAGVVTSLSLLSRIDRNGWLQTPYFYVKEGVVKNTSVPIFLTPGKEAQTRTSFESTGLTHEKEIPSDYLSVKEDYIFSNCKREDIDFLIVTPLQIIAAGTGLIPFLEHNDANRVLMGSNMQRQAVPLLYTQKAIVGTGHETAILQHSAMALKARLPGYVVRANGLFIEIFEEVLNQKMVYKLDKFRRSNQETCINQKPLVWPGEYVEARQIIADGPSSNDGELALGRNLTVAYMPWEGYNYEDAIVISQRLVDQDCLTSVHIHTCQTRIEVSEDGSLEQLTDTPPYTTAAMCRHLSSEGSLAGTPKIGSYVIEYDLLIGKKIRKWEAINPMEALLTKVRMLPTLKPTYKSKDAQERRIHKERSNDVKRHKREYSRDFPITYTKTVVDFYFELVRFYYEQEKARRARYPRKK